MVKVAETRRLGSSRVKLAQITECLAFLFSLLWGTVNPLLRWPFQGRSAVASEVYAATYLPGQLMTHFKQDMRALRCCTEAGQVDERENSLCLYAADSDLLPPLQRAITGTWHSITTFPSHQRLDSITVFNRIMHSQLQDNGHFEHSVTVGLCMAGLILQGCKCYCSN